jgi:hypothetical protein
MAFTYGAGPLSARTETEARKAFGTGERQGPSKPKSPNLQTAIRAELIGTDTCIALGITVEANTPVLAMCRALVESGHDPAIPLEAYRGDVLCLRVRSIGDGAGLRVASHGRGFERLPECTAASLMRQNGGGGA